ncbi:hypothetical protein CPB86DRAFT_783414 [Serendipita vermifera]|nr:hypothetical protein CPB86DRAFT_783414 [Serendipita vermifera]
MYCLNGTTGRNGEDSNEAAYPVFRLPKSEWWMHHDTRCDEFPPNDGDFLLLPAGGKFTVEIAINRAFTSLSYGGRHVTEWGDGQHHPENYSVENNGGAPVVDGCLATPNFHTKNEAGAAGTVFAISYQSDIRKVTPENLVVFTVRHHTPWKLRATYDVPKMLPACPPGGCHCVWGWVPDHCGQYNMYIHPYKCKVIDTVGLDPVAPGQPPIWCEGDPTNCVKGSKQMIFSNQLDGNNVFVEGHQADGLPKSPGYNRKMGFKDGAQNDIFLDSSASRPEPHIAMFPISKRVSSRPQILRERHRRS